MKHGLMKSAAIAALVLVTAPANAQQGAPQGGMNHSQHMAGGAGMGQMGPMGQMGGKPEMMQMMMQMMQMMMQMHGGEMGGMGAMGDMGTMGQMGQTDGGMQMGAMGQIPATEPGQGAFAAIGEIVAALEADPNTDWSKVNIDALRAHLVDMDMVVTWAKVETEPTDFGARFVVSGDDKVAGSIQRMVVAHAGVMEGVDGWSYMAEPTDTGAVLEVTVPEADMAKLNALGFFGILTSGMHHQRHHWMMATGMNPHQ